MTSTVPKGLATWAGIIAAIGQYLLAIALFLDTFDQTDPAAGIAALVTATATLWKVVDGRMKQAQTLARVDAAKDLKLQALQKAGAVPGALYAFENPTAAPAPEPDPPVRVGDPREPSIPHQHGAAVLDFGEGNTTGCQP